MVTTTTTTSTPVRDCFDCGHPTGTTVGCGRCDAWRSHAAAIQTEDGRGVKTASIRTAAGSVELRSILAEMSIYTDTSGRVFLEEHATFRVRSLEVSIDEGGPSRSYVSVRAEAPPSISDVVMFMTREQAVALRDALSQALEESQ